MVYIPICFVYVDFVGGFSCLVERTDLYWCTDSHSAPCPWCHMYSRYMDGDEHRRDGTDIDKIILTVL